jgi:hypothetical protein
MASFLKVQYILKAILSEAAQAPLSKLTSSSASDGLRFDDDDGGRSVAKSQRPLTASDGLNLAFAKVAVMSDSYFFFRIISVVNFE